MNKTIGIIGSGMIGGQVARLAAAAELNVVICNSRGPETLANLIAELGKKARSATFNDVVAATNFIVLAMPFGIYKKLSASQLADKTLIDTMNYYPERDGVMSEVKTDKISTSELVQAHLSQSAVVRAINNMDYIRLLSSARPKGAKDRSALPIASDHAAAKAETAEFLDKLGYDTIDMGPLSESWRSEPTMPIYVNPYWKSEKRGELTSTRAASFMTAPGQVVNLVKAKELLSAAVRHDKMIGQMGNFDEALNNE